jgi:hypothetical protein
MKYMNKENFPELYEDTFQVLKKDTEKAKTLAKNVVHKMLLEHAKEEGILSRFDKGHPIETVSELYHSFEYCRKPKHVAKYVNVFYLFFDRYKKWRVDVRYVIMMQMGWFLDNSDIVDSPKKQDCLYKLAGQYLNEVIKNCNRHGRLENGMTITTSRLEELKEKK